MDSDRDLANFPPEFTDEPVQLTVDEEYAQYTIKSNIYFINLFYFFYSHVIDRIDQSEFEGFEYVNPLLMSLEDCV